MKRFLLIAAFIATAARAGAQNYERNPVCGTDTVIVHSNPKLSGSSYEAFECTKVSKLGVRVELGFNHYRYNPKTRNWLGNHNGPLLGLAIAYGDFSLGVKFKPATVTPRQELVFNGVALTKDATLNPNKIDVDLSYSINFKYNISLEPFIALTSNSFLVINEEELGRQYQIDKTRGLTLGTTLNKYFRLKNFQFFSVFARYGYGFSDFKKTHNSLGAGYGDIVLGVAYKGFIKQTYWKRL
ncbi:MAG: hypothetical protein J7599_07970 [Niabella sp.]|nr:hypothetical protein [Niabella sp.]